MIDLTQKGLPVAIVLNGKSFSINTDFREWIKFDELIKTDRTILDFYYLFKDEKPNATQSEHAYRKLLEFFTNQNTTPRPSGSGERITDFYHDGEFIYSAFMQHYKIDLAEEDMHWHKFNALYQAIFSSNTFYAKILGYRSYEKTDKKHEEIMTELKADWELPYEPSQEELKALKEFEQKHGIS